VTVGIFFGKLERVFSVFWCGLLIVGGEREVWIVKWESVSVAGFTYVSFLVGA
jgi:hypothetical protein